MQNALNTRQELIGLARRYQGYIQKTYAGHPFRLRGRQFAHHFINGHQKIVDQWASGWELLFHINVAIHLLLLKFLNV